MISMPLFRFSLPHTLFSRRARYAAARAAADATLTLDYAICRHADTLLFRCRHICFTLIRLRQYAMMSVCATRRQFTLAITPRRFSLRRYATPLLMRFFAIQQNSTNQ